MSTATVMAAPSRGELAHNAMMVGMLQAALSGLESNLDTIPGLLDLIASRGCWRAFKFPDQPEPVRWNAADFRQFIEARRPAGCETPIGVLLRAVRDTPAAATVERLLRGDAGGCHVEGGHNPDGRNQWFNRDIVTVEPPSDLPSTIPFAPPPEPPKRVRDYKREAPTGTSTSYLLRQLERGRKVKGGEALPARPDLLEKVRKGEMTPHAAAVAAGYVRPKITMEADPVRASRVLVKHFQGEALTTLIRELANWAGYELTERS